MPRPPRPPPEAYIRQTLVTAGQGDYEALRTISALSGAHHHIFRRALPVISRHLQCDLPPTADGATPCQEEISATMAILILRNGICGTQGPTEIFMMTELTNLLRWMLHLFTSWIFDEQAAAVGTIPLDMRNSVRETVPCVLHKLTDIVEAPVLQNHALAGPLLARIHLVAHREKLEEMAHMSMLIRDKLFELVHSSHQIESDFFEVIRLHPDAFATGAISQLRDYSQNTVHYMDEVHSILSVVYKVILRRPQPLDNVTDACLEQPHIIRACTRIISDAIGFLTVRDTPTPSMREIASEVVVFTSIVLFAGFARGGAPLVSVAVKNQLLTVILILIAIPQLDEKLSPLSFRLLDVMTAQFMNALIPYVIYPAVLRNTYFFFDEFDSVMDEYKDQGPPSKLVDLNETLLNLRSRLNLEYEIFDGLIGAAHGATSDYLNPFKFCDNSQCPSKGKVTKLGECTRCRSAYYCSRHCQNVVWKNGHKDECEEIIASKMNGKEGYPPILTIHEREYFNRTLLPRFHYLTVIAPQRNKMLLEIKSNTIYGMNLSMFPFGVEWREEEVDDGTGPWISAKIPRGLKLEDEPVHVSAKGPACLDWHPAYAWSKPGILAVPKFPEYA